MARDQFVRQLAVLVANGQAREAVELAEKLLNSGYDVQSVVENGLTKALESLDVKCNNDQFNLLEILLAGRAVMEVMDQVICPHLDKHGEHGWEACPGRKGTVVLGTILGDIHDLGKNIVAILLRMAGYKVVDLGKDVAPAVFAAEALRHDADFVGVSNLITSTMHHIKEIRPALEEAGLSHVTILAGGAAVRQANAKELNVDFVADNVFEMLGYLQILAMEE
ncbi:MAG: hypothetical protein GX750_05750 [Clostridia bacterium]|nr:hypothetical protein [Clostridia bacterium]